MGHGLVTEEPAPLGNSDTTQTQRDDAAEVDAAIKLGEQLSQSLSLAESSQESSDEPQKSSPDHSIQTISVSADALRPTVEKSALAHPSALSARLYSNPHLAALRSPAADVSVPKGDQANHLPSKQTTPLLANPKCSGYFVEPVRTLSAS